MDYFVNDQYFVDIRSNPSVKIEIDKTIDYEYLKSLNQNCEYNRQTKAKLEYKAYQYSHGQYR